MFIEQLESSWPFYLVCLKNPNVLTSFLTVNSTKTEKEMGIHTNMLKEISISSVVKLHAVHWNASLVQNGGMSVAWDLNREKEVNGKQYTVISWLAWKEYLKT